MIDSKPTYTESTIIDLTPEMTVAFKRQQHYMLELLHRTLWVHWEHDDELKEKIEKWSYRLAGGR